jgi:ligand-binding sensor domain-containing protein/signal transduction histidine kinase
MRHKLRPPALFLVICFAFLPAVPVLAEGHVTTPSVPLVASNPQAQTNTIRFERISLKEGLSQGTITAIWQDSQGYMWFGTEDGLNKYDGIQFAVYKHDPEDPLTLSDNYISAIYEDKNGDLWIGTRSGLDRFDRTAGIFTHFQHDPDDPNSLGGTWVTAIHEDRDGSFWVGTIAGLDLLDRNTDNFVHYRHVPDDPSSLADDYVRVLYETSGGELWVGTNSGLDLFDQKDETFIHYQHDPRDLQSLSDNQITGVQEDREGTLWIGTTGGGLNQLNRASNSFIRYQHNPEDPHSLSHNRVLAILQDNIGRLWIGTQNGLDQLDRNRNLFIHYHHDPGDLYSLSSNTIWSIFEDRTGVLWVGTYGGGISKRNRSADQFVLYQQKPNIPNSLSENMVWSISEDRNGMLWIGTFNGGLNKLDRISDTYSVYQNDPSDPTSIVSNDIRAILEDHTGALWVGTNSGLDRFDSKTETFTHYPNDPDDPSTISDDQVRALYEDSLGNLWVGTRTGGLNRFDRASESFIRYQHDPDDPTSLSDDRVWSLYEDSSGKLWVGTLGGINVLEPLSNRFTRYLHDPDDPQSLSNNAIFSFHEDPTGMLWVGTWGTGLDHFDPATQTFTHFTEKDGLPNNVIYGIEVDGEGFLWLSTNRGLSKFDPRTETFRNYDISDGLQDIEFNVGAHFRSDRGEMFFGGISGFNTFYPEQIKDNPNPPPIVITSFAKFNQKVRTDLSEGEHIQLSYKDNFISFEFIVLDYNAPKKNQYAYMLEGFDQDWVNAGARRYASYTNLSGGNYVFRVKGSNSDGVWNEEGSAVRITVTPPIWETWWFQGILALVLVGGVFGYYRLRVRNFEKRSQELEEQVEERTGEIERRTQELEALYQADEELYRRVHLEEVLQTLVHIAVDILKADKSSLLLWDEYGENLAVSAARGFQQQTLAQMTFAPGEGTVGIVATTGESVIVEDTKDDTRVLKRFIDPEGIRSLMHVPIKIEGQIFGVFNVNYVQPRAFGVDEQRLFEALAQRAALAIETAQLYEQSQELAVVQERSRIARDLHDAVTQTLFSASMIAEVLPRIWEQNADQGLSRLGELRELTRGALAEMRTLLLELRPAALIEADLAELLRQLAESVIGRARIQVSVEADSECDLPPEVKIACYRIAQEALNNVAKHAGANQAWVSLSCLEEEVILRIKDDGCGFDPTNITPDQLGMGIMHERADDINAKLDVSSEIDQGTQIQVVWKRT